MKEAQEIENCKFVKLLKKYPCLYDPDDKNYLQKHIIKKVWMKVAAEYKTSVPKCKARWKNIRTAYLRFLKAKASTDPKYRNYYLSDALQFLYPIYLKKFDHLTNVPSPQYDIEPVEDDSDVDNEETCGKGKHDLDKNSFDNLSDEGDTEFQDIMEELNFDSENNSLDVKVETPDTYVNHSDKRPLVHYFQKRKNDDEECDDSSIGEHCDHKTKKILSESLSADEQFLLSLKDDLSEMNSAQKRQFKKGVYDLIAQILDGSTNTSNQYVLALTPSAPMPSSFSNNVTQTVSSSNLYK